MNELIVNAVPVSKIRMKFDEAHKELMELYDFVVEPVVTDEQQQIFELRGKLKAYGSLIFDEQEKAEVSKVIDAEIKAAYKRFRERPKRRRI